MNCWKSFNISKQYGTFKLILLSVMGSVFFYISFYLLFESLFLSARFSGLNLITLIAAMILVWPVHKMLHILPIVLAGKKATISIEKSRLHSIPVIYTNIPCTLKKINSIIMVTFPLVLINGLSLISVFVFPSHIYFFAFIGAMNFGFSIKDIVYLSHLINAPADAFIEDDRDACRILVKQAI